MISVHEAEALILQRIMQLPEEHIPLRQSTGRVLREELLADRDFPPFDRVTMDGIAMCFAAFQRGIRAFPVRGIVAAGQPQEDLDNDLQCLEIMTGAVLPKGCDTVIRYEDIRIAEGIATIQVEEVRQGQNIHRQGEDRRQGEVIVHGGTVISPAEIGVAATVGKSSLRVSVPPKVAIISTGDELVDIDTPPMMHQIRQSNVHQICALLSRYHIHADTYHLPDDAGAIRDDLESILTEHDVLILSGGVSAGRYDYVPDALTALGVREIFHKVAQRPGKPFWFGATSQDKVVFALPGNPLSSFMCTVRYILPWLEAGLGVPQVQRYAILSQEFSFKPALTFFLPVKLHTGEDATCHASPMPGHGSGDLANLVVADAFLELPAGKSTFQGGERYQVWPYR